MCNKLVKVIIFFLAAFSVTLYSNRFLLNSKNAEVKLETIKDYFSKKQLLRNEIVEYKERSSNSRGDSLNCTLVGGWFNGSSNASFSKDTLIYINDGNYLKILNARDPSYPVLLGVLRTPSIITDIFVKDSIAYLADSYGGLRIVNILDPTNPFEISCYVEGNFYSLEVRDTLVYVSDLNTGVRIINIADLLNPEEIGFFDVDVRDLCVKDSLVYLVDLDYLYIIKVSDPANPEELSSLKTHYARGVFVQDSLVYVADDTEGLRVVNVSDPNNPVEVASYYPTGMNRAFEVFVKDTIAYVVDDWFGMLLIDVSDPKNMIGTDRYDTGILREASNVYVNDTFAYLAYNYDGFHIVNVSDPYNVFRAGHYATGGHTYGVFIQDTIAYLANFTEGLRILNISNPLLPEELVLYEMEQLPTAVWVKDTIAYVKERQRVTILNVASPSDPAIIGYYNSEIDDFFIKDTIAYVAEGEKGLHIVNLSNPASLQEIGFYDPEDFDARNVFVVDTFAYVGNHSYGGKRGVNVINVSDPANPREWGGYYEVAPYEFYMKDTLAFLVSNWRTLVILNFADPKSPLVINSFFTGSYCDRRLNISGNLAYITEESKGLNIYDFSDPENLVLVGSYPTGDFPKNVYVKDSIAYLADVRDGFYMIRYTGISDGILQELQEPITTSSVINSLSEIKINYIVTGVEEVQISVYNILGQKVASLVDKMQSSGRYTISWKSNNSGIYFVRLKIGKYVKTYKTMFIR